MYKAEDVANYSKGAGTSGWREQRGKFLKSHCKTTLLA